MIRKKQDITIARTANFLRERDKFLLLCHRYPDGDTLGSAFALCRALLKLGKAARVLCPDDIPPKYDYLFSDLDLPDFDEECVITLDIADPHLLGRLAERYGDAVDLCIDHHGSNKKYAAYNLVDSKCAAAGELVYKIILKLGLAIDRDMAAGLYTAISTDTGCFRFSNVTAQTHRITAGLLAAGVDFMAINTIMFETKSRARMEIERAVFDTLEYFSGGEIAIVRLTGAVIERSGADDSELEGIANIPRRIEGVKIGVLLREVPDGCRISMRTVTGINASDICGFLGGGGHPCAAGATVPGDLDEAARRVLWAIGEYNGK